MDTSVARVMLAFAAAAAILAGTARADDAFAAPSGVPPGGFRPVGPLPGTSRHTPAHNPYADDAAALMDGRRLFVQFNCAGCHGGHAGGGMGPSLRDTVWIYGGDDEDVFSSIAEGRARGMPAWGSMLPDEVIWKLTAYVRALRTEREPQPPR